MYHSLFLLIVRNLDVVKTFFQENSHRLTNSAILRLLRMVKSPDDGKFAILLVDFYQKRGKDFDEQIASAFVKASVIGGKSKEAANLCAVYKNRIGSWLTPKSLDALISDLCSANELELTLTMLENLIKKGVVANITSFETILEAGARSEEVKSSDEFKARVSKVASIMLPLEAYQSLTTRYSLPAPAAVESTESAQVTQDNADV